MRSKTLKFLLTITLAIASITLLSHTAHADTVMRSHPDYKQSSEIMPYPDVKKIQDLNVLVEIKQNRVFIRDGQHIIYTMYCSAGKTDPNTHKSYTPTGHFVIQPEHGDNFYNHDLKEGANYWTSFKDHGIYLFHTVPTNQDGNYKSKPAKLLGQKPDSHGCIRLSIPDAKFIQTLPVGTPVTIEE